MGSASGAHTCTFTLDSSLKNLTIHPQVGFAYSESVTVTLTTGIQSNAGDPLVRPYVFAFTSRPSSLSTQNHSGTLAGDETWTSDKVHVITADVTIPTNRVLTIQAGTVVKFQIGDIDLFVDGVLSLQSTPTSKIAFVSYRNDLYGGDTNGDGTATSAASGDWGTICYRTATTNRLHDALVRFGGRTNTNMIDVYGGAVVTIQRAVIESSLYRGVRVGNANSHLTVDRCTFAGHTEQAIYVESATTASVTDNIVATSKYGVYVSAVGSMAATGNMFTANTWGVYQNSATVWSLTNNTFTSNTYPVYQGPWDLGYGGNTFTKNQYQAIVVGGTLSQNATWEDVQGLGLAYVVNADVTIPAGKTLTIGAGVVVKFMAVDNLAQENVYTYRNDLIVTGTLNLLGTAGQRVVFTSSRDDTYGGDSNGDGAATTPATGNWGAIKYTNPANVLHDVVVRYGGVGYVYYHYDGTQGYHYDYYDTQMVWAAGTAAGTLQIQDSTIEKAYADAIYLAAGSAATNIRNSTIKNNAQDAVEVNAGSAYIEYCTFQEYGTAGVHITGSGTATARHNNYEDTQKDYGVKSDRTVWVDARNCWWGNPSGPGPIATGTGAKVSNYVLYAPWETQLVGGFASGPGTLSGQVFDAVTGQAVAGATVTIPDQDPVETGPQGEFGFTGLWLGSTVVQVTRSGYYDATRTVVVTESGSTVLNVVMTPEAGGTFPAVVQVLGAYCGPDQRAYYLDGVTLSETFTVTIDWKGYTPGVIQWTTPLGTFEQPADQTGRTFDMGTAFSPGGTLRIVAIAGGGGPQSAPYIVNMRVIPPPPIVNLIPGALYAAMPIGDGIEYRVLGLSGASIDLANWSPTQVDTGFPLFGGQEMKIGIELDEDPGPFDATLSGTVDSGGKCSLLTVGWEDSEKKVIRKGVKCRKGIKLPFTEVGGSASVEIDFYWSDYDNAWMPGGELDLGCNFLYSSPQIPVAVIVFIPVYVRAEVGLDVELALGIEGWSEIGPHWFGGYTFEPGVKGILGAGVAGVACVEGYLGGRFHGEVNYLPQPEWGNAYIVLLGGVRAVLGPFTFGPLELQYIWPDQGGKRMPSMDEMLRGKGWVLLPRDYLRYPKPDTRSAPKRLRDGSEGPIEEVVFPYSTPDVTPVGNNVLAVWIADNTQLSLINRTELRYATSNGTTWSSVTPVVGDGTADLNPRLVSLPSGKAVCVWQDANAVLNDTDPFDVFLSHVEIAVATYDPNVPGWSPPTRITNDAVFDRSPNIAASAANNMLAVWISNAANDMWGSATAPNTIKWSRFNGASWTAPAELATGFGTILDTALAYNGTTGTFVFCTDADDNMDTTTDQELWAATYSGGAWSVPTRLTNDAVCDAAPRLAYSGATLRLAWLKGDDIRFATGTDVANSTVVVTPHESMGSKDFDLVISASGRIALVWSDASETYQDLWVSYYEPTQQAWSKSRQLTFDDAAERFVSGAFDTADKLFAVYDKTQTQYADQQVEINGQTVDVQGVPGAGQSDLYYLSYQMRGDLAVARQDVNVTPPNPLPGTTATITAKIRNIGESPASNIQVAFYAGNPDAGGTLIQMAVVAGPLVGGGEAETSASWSVPASADALAVYVRIDPNLVQEDRDRTNNTASFWVLAPDLTISQISVQAAGPHRIITVRVANEGTLDVPGVDVVLRRDSTDGEVLTTFSVTEPILAGAYRDLSWVWLNVAPIVGDSIPVFAIVDEDDLINEFDEENNVRSTTLANAPPSSPGDWDHDGYVDIDDFFAMPDCMSGPWGAPDWVMPSQDCRDVFDFNADADVDLLDFAEFQRGFTGGLK